MSQDLFEQLAARDVPPPPEQFNRQLHGRLNMVLSGVHLLEFVCRAAPLAAWEMAAGLCAAFCRAGRKAGPSPEDRT